MWVVLNYLPPIKALTQQIEEAKKEIPQKTKNQKLYLMFQQKKWQNPRRNSPS